MVNIISSRYMFRSLPMSSSGTIMAMIIMIPPIVGVPFLLFSPCNPRFRMVSPIWCERRRPMMRLPIIIEKNRDNIRVIAALNDMYSNNPAPGRSNSFSKYLKR